MVFRAPFGALTPAERASAARRRLRAMAPEIVAGTDTVAVATTSAGSALVVGDRPIFLVLPADVDTVAGMTLSRTVEDARRALAELLLAEREARSVPAIARGFAYSVLGTVVLVAALVLLRRVHRASLGLLPRIGRIGDVGAAKPVVSGVLLGGVPRVVDVLAWAAALFGVYLWLTFVLTRFAHTRPIGATLGTFLVSTAGRLGTSMLDALPDLLTVAVIFLVTRWITRLVGALLDAEAAGRLDLPLIHPDLVPPTKKLLTVALWLFAIIVAYPYIPGSGSDAFKGVSVFAGLVLTLGSSGLVNQAMSGLVLMYSRALRVGDYVRIGEREGTITSLSLLTTKMVTPRREEVILPNAVVTGNDVVNYSRSAEHGDVVIGTSVTIGYDTPWRQVHALLLRAAERSDGVRRQPAPYVLQTALTDFYVEYRLCVHPVDPHRRAVVLDEVHRNILDAFNEFGVQIMSPHYETNVPQPAIVPRERWYAAPAQDGDGAAPAVRASDAVLSPPSHDVQPNGA
jgi:small-conductance mechanosensitive channel